MAAKDAHALASKYYGKKNFSKALFYLQKASRAQPRNTNFLMGMANCYMQLGDRENGIKTIKKILKIDKDNDGLYYQLSQVYFKLGNIESTIKACQQALDINPQELGYYLHIADVYEKTNQHAEALEVLARGIHYFPDDASLQILSARSERRLGKIRECSERLQALSDRESGMPPEWKISYHFELGFTHDKNDSTELAFHHFTRANDLIRAQPSYQGVDANHSLNLIDRIGKLDYGKINQIIDISKKCPPPVQPVFFVGFPRSGTTLLQKVLDSHHGIHVIEENNPLGQVTSLVESDQEKYLESSFLMNEKNLIELREIYFNRAREFAPIDDGSLTVDKLPINIVQIHIIKILFPDARILLGLRHPCDSILSCFMQHFAVNRAMANMFDFGSIVKYYDQTMGLWQIFKNNIRFESHSVRYEDLVENMEQEVRELLQFLDLPWDEEVMNYRQNAFNRGFINTPSYSQVVKPIYKEARYRWHRYAKFFEPHYEVLKPHCDAFGYSLEGIGPG